MSSCTEKEGRAKAVLMFAVLACAAVLAASLFAGAGQAWAVSYSTFGAFGGKACTVSYKGKAHDLGYRVYVPTEAQGEKPTNIKSSNAAVATAKAVKFQAAAGSVYHLRVTLKKAGTTKLTFKHNGKSYAVKYVVKSYTNPLSTFKVGSKDYASYFNPKKLGKGCDTSSTSSVAVEGFSGKASVKAKSGWKINYMSMHSNVIAMGGFKNGDKLDNMGQLDISLTNKKTGQVQFLYLIASKAGQLQAASVRL